MDRCTLLYFDNQFYMDDKMDVFFCFEFIISFYKENKFMSVAFYYANNPYIQIETISIIGAFNNYVEFETSLEAVKGGWEITLELTPGKHQYKFIINGVLRLNDPNASEYSVDQEGEVWSIVHVDNRGKLGKNINHGTLQLTDYIITKNKMNLVEEARYINNFNLNMDSTVFAGFEFSHILGIHTITVVWVNSLYQLHHISDHYIEVKEGDENDAVDVWFWIDLQEKEREYPQGTWYAKLLVNGAFVMEDKFTIGRGGTYRPTSTGILVNQSLDISR